MQTIVFLDEREGKVKMFQSGSGLRAMDLPLKNGLVVVWGNKTEFQALVRDIQEQIIDAPEMTRTVRWGGEENERSPLDSQSASASS